MRVLLFDHTASLGGGEIALLYLVQNLNPEVVKPIVVLGAKGPLVDRLSPGVETHVFPLEPIVGSARKNDLGFSTLFQLSKIFHLLKYVWRLSRFISEQQIDLIHTNSLKADIIGGFAGRLARRPVVWHVRDRIADDYLPNSVATSFRFLCRVLPTFVITNSLATLQTLRLRNVNLRDGEFQITKSAAVVHDGTPVDIPHGSPHARSDCFRVGLIGRISPWKGQDIFLRAASLVARRVTNVRFLIIGAALFGEREYEERVRRMPAELGIQNITEFTGFCSEIQSVISNLDLVVHASTTGEPFGQVIIEAMAASKPVVATNGGGVPEIVEDGITGILVPMGKAEPMADAICEILTNPKRASEMGIRGRRRVEQKFTLTQTAEKIQAVYRTIVDRTLDSNNP